MVFLIKTSMGGEGFEEEDDKFLFVLCAQTSVWVVGKSLEGGGKEKAKDL